MITFSIKFDQEKSTFYLCVTGQFHLIFLRIKIEYLYVDSFQRHSGHLATENDYIFSTYYY